MPDSEASLVLAFDDNRLLADLVGEHDVHLALIEDRIGVSAICHGNLITLGGTATRIALAQEVVEHLTKRLKAGDVIMMNDVDGAIRHALAPDTAAEPAAEAERSDSKKGRAPARAASSAGNGRGVGRAGSRGALKGAAQIKTRLRTIEAQTPRQTAYIRSLESKDLVFATGPAGTGKTYIAVAYAAMMLDRNEVKRLILSRPAVEAGERLGFLPGDMKDKVDPYLRPLYDALNDTLGAERVQKGIESQIIEVAPLAFMRGRTLSDAFVILDEAQNTTTMQMKMFLTRLGEGSKMVITGDPSQVDLPPGQTSGLPDAVGRLRNIEDIDIITFEGSDVVRRELVMKIVAAYDK